MKKYSTTRREISSCVALIVLWASCAGGGGSGGGGSGGTSGSGGGNQASGGAPATGSGGRGAGGGQVSGSGGTPSSTGGVVGSGGAGATVATGGRSSSGGGGGGPVGTGGSTTGGGGQGAPGAKLGTGGPFPFPQNRRSGMCTLTTAANASASVQTAYDGWKTAFVTASGAGANLRVRRPDSADDTVSEGIGYGMLAAVYMADRATFDGLWNYAKANLDAKGLMNWQISATGTVLGMGSASDADEDIAWALLMASNQWSSTVYLEDARAQINAILTNSITADGMLKPGDGWGISTATFPDYFSPAYFRVFAVATNNPRWSGDILDRNYTILMNVQGTYGLVPDRSSATYSMNGTYGYDACRTPWRIGMDYCFNGEPRAQAYLAKIGAFFDGIGAANIGDGYALGGMQVSANKNMAFIGPAGVAGMAGFPTLLDGAFAFGASNLGDQKYYPQSLRVITMLMMSGNFLDYSRL